MVHMGGWVGWVVYSVLCTYEYTSVITLPPSPISIPHSQGARVHVPRHFPASDLQIPWVVVLGVCVFVYRGRSPHVRADASPFFLSLWRFGV